MRDEGDFEGWLRFFLTGVRDIALEATETARRVLAMRDEHLTLVHASVGSRFAAPLLEELLMRPAVTPNGAAERLDVSYQTANQLIAEFEAIGLLREITGRRRNRVFVYQPYVDRLGGRFEP